MNKLQFGRIFEIIMEFALMGSVSHHHETQRKLQYIMMAVQLIIDPFLVNWTCYGPCANCDKVLHFIALAVMCT